ncbi:hypothetical protein DFP73DRAFT_599110 [Morchella snyderi]|nr:hypothetical protein DFP73DRAFT_599110 [Morchella snyderi]
MPGENRALKGKTRRAAEFKKQSRVPLEQSGALQEQSRVRQEQSGALQEHSAASLESYLPTERPERPQRPQRLAEVTGLLMFLA